LSSYEPTIDCSKWSSSEAAGDANILNLPSGYIEDGFKSRTQLEIISVERAAAQNELPTRPQAKNAPEAYPTGYVEDAFETRTPLEVVFSGC
jgi:hypothetical protein